MLLIDNPQPLIKETIGSEFVPLDWINGIELPEGTEAADPIVSEWITDKHNKKRLSDLICFFKDENYNQYDSFEGISLAFNQQFADILPFLKKRARHSRFWAFSNKREIPDVFRVTNFVTYSHARQEIALSGPSSGDDVNALYVLAGNIGYLLNEGFPYNVVATLAMLTTCIPDKPLTDAQKCGCILYMVNAINKARHTQKKHIEANPRPLPWRKLPFSLVPWARTLSEWERNTFLPGMLSHDQFMNVIPMRIMAYVQAEHVVVPEPSVKANKVRSPRFYKYFTLAGSRLVDIAYPDKFPDFPKDTPAFRLGTTDFHLPVFGGIEGVGETDEDCLYTVYVPRNRDAYVFLCKLYGLKPWDRITPISAEHQALLRFDDDMSVDMIIKEVIGQSRFKLYYDGKANLVDMLDYDDAVKPITTEVYKFYQQ